MAGVDPRLEEAHQRRRAKGWHGWYGPDRAPWDEALEEFLASALCPAPGRALDLGCGGGEQAIRLAALGWEVTGLDVAPTAIAMAHANAEAANAKIDFLLHDAREELPFDPGLFDLILDNNLLHGILEPGERHSLLRNVHRALSIDGIFLSANMSAEGNLDCDRWRIDPATRIDADCTRFWATRDEIEAEFAEAALEILRLRLVPQPDGSGSGCIVWAKRRRDRS